MADSHDRTAFDLPLQLHGIDDDAGIDGDGVLLNHDCTCTGSHGNLANAGPIGSAA